MDERWNVNATALALRDDTMFLPVMDMEVAIARRNHVVDFTKRIMVEGVDFGKIPGAGDKPTLLKPGAEKLATFFGLTPMFIPVSVVEDWTGDDHKGEAFFYYRYRCELHRNGNLVASSEGSCNTWESKYRYRKGERVCPKCGQANIIKGKDDYGGGWLCFKKKGGCGATFKDGDTAIESQSVGRVQNPDVADQVNTVQKMAQKRALIAATLLAVNASEFYTQDIEDMVIDGEWTPVVEPKQLTQGRTQQPPQDNPFEDVDFAPEPKAQKVMASAYDLVKWASDLHRNSDGPCTPKQYQYLTGLVDALTDGNHGYVFALICESEISKDNMVGRKLASELLVMLPEQIVVKDAEGKAVKDGNGKSVMTPNPAYRKDICEIIASVVKQPVTA